MQYEVNLFRVDTVATDTATESITDAITQRAGYETSKDGKHSKWAWYKITDGDLQNARQAIRRFKSANFPKRVAVEELRQEFNPYSGFVSAFLQWLLEYPRIQIYVHDTPLHVEIGGVEYIDEDTPPDFEESLKGALEEHEYSTGGFDNQCMAFKNFVAWVGNETNCNRAAQNVILAFDALVEAFRECGINEFADLSKAYEHTTKALEEMCAALAGTQTQTAQGKSKATQATQSGSGASDKPYLFDLNPEQSKADAREFMARLVCYVWCMIPEYKSKDKACDYVFQSANDGDRLYADCNHARNLLKAYNYNPNTIKTEAAKLHAKLGAWRKKTGLEWPDNWRDMVRKSQAKEAKSAKQRKGRN